MTDSFPLGDGLLGRLMSNQTINGHQIDSILGTQLADLHTLLQGYQEEFLFLVQHEIKYQNYLEFDLSLAEMLTQTNDCKSVFDVPELESDLATAALMGALGLRLVDEMLVSLKSGPITAAALSNWDRMSFTAREGMWFFVRSEKIQGQMAISQHARKAAIALHAKSPYAEARAFASDQWREWSQKPQMYKSSAAFSRDIVDKFPVISNPITVERWVRRWRDGDDE